MMTAKEKKKKEKPLLEVRDPSLLVTRKMKAVTKEVFSIPAKRVQLSSKI